MGHELCDRLYVTEVEGEFAADVFHPPIDQNLFRPVE